MSGGPRGRRARAGAGAAAKAPPRVGRIQLQNRQRRVPLPRAWILRSLEAVLREGACALGLSVVYVDNPTLKELNARFHAADRLTDVLAFPLAGGSDAGPGEERLLGEVLVSADRAEQESRWRGLPLDRELTLYAVHGTLHLLGYDDHTPAGRREMRRRERAALAAGQLG